MVRRRFKGHFVVSLVIGLCVVVSSSLLVVTTGLGGGAGPVATDGGVGLWQVKQGLVASYAFDHPEPLRDIEDAFDFNGSASPGVGYATVSTRGLGVGVRGDHDRFEGWFAVSSASYPQNGVYHVQMSRLAGNVSAPGAQGEAVFAVQTGTTKLNGLINYVVVASNSRLGQTVWTIGYAHGKIADARLETLARIGPMSSSAPVTQTISLTTDGRHRLAVYFGNQLVYSSDRLHLDIQPPFQPYLEVQAIRVPYESFFQEMWVTSDQTVRVDGVAPGWQLSLRRSDGTVVSTTTASSGEARLDLPAPAAHGRATLIARRGNRTVRLGPIEYSGGDTYRLSGLTS